jgi:hypothetical protein
MERARGGLTERIDLLETPQHVHRTGRQAL